MTEKLTKCPHCGGEIQATRVTEDYYSLRNGEWHLWDTSEVTELRVYCGNDCVLDKEYENEKIKEMP